MRRLLPLSLACLALFVAAAEDSVRVSVWAVRAAREGRQEKAFSEGLDAVKNILTRLPYDTFTEVKSYDSKAISLGKESALPLDTAYTLALTPVSREEDGRIKMQLKVQMAPKSKDQKPVEALSATLLVKPQDKIKLQGLHGEKGDLIIIFQVL